jgi:hypothetical protein
VLPGDLGRLSQVALNSWDSETEDMARLVFPRAQGKKTDVMPGMVTHACNPSLGKLR